MADPVPSNAPVPPGGDASYLTDRRKTDRNYLLALSIFHYLLALLTGAICVQMVWGFISMRRFMNEMYERPPHAAMWHTWDWFWPGMAVVFGLAAVLNAASAWCMLRRKAWTLSVVVAGLDLIYFPVGTVLGIFTLIVLLRGSVGDWYKENAAPGVRS